MSYFRIQKDKTVAILAGAAVYTSDPIHLNQYNRLTGIVKSDQSGSLAVQQSSDGTNWDHITTIAVTGGTGKEIDVKVYGEYARLVYTNGATDQTVFRMTVFATPSGS